MVASRQGKEDEFFALAELSFLHGENTGKKAYYLAAAVYAFAFLFPDEADTPPNAFDPRLRVAAELYNRGLAEGFASAEGTEVELRAGVYPLPFGELEVEFDPADLRWAEDRQLVNFVPAAELEIYGLQNRYRRPGIGAPLAAGTVPLDPQQGFQGFIAPRAKVPVTALLRIPEARRQLTDNRVRASLELYAATDLTSVHIEGRQVPLEVEPTAALAFQLSQSLVWEWEYKGFLRGDLSDLLPEKETRQLAAIEPYYPGRFPVVFVHGTVSSPGRWADMVNDLYNDPVLRDQFQFWFFFYNTGNPIPYSALLLREALQKTIEQLDPQGQDPALRQMIVIGHSQGGLLAKMTAIETGTRLWDSLSQKPLEALKLQPQTRKLLQQGFFLEPLPFVHRLVFIATPHRGSYAAGGWLSQQIAGFVRLPKQLLTTTTDLLRNPDIFRAFEGRVGSVYGMTPGSPFIQGLASIPVAPDVATHSIIAVRGEGPVEEGSDGIVEYRSAHLEDADSERVVRSGHSAQSNPHTIAEVRRILLLHAAEAGSTNRNRLE